MKTIFSVLMLILFALPLRAQQPVISFGGSTLGATFEAGYRVGPNFGLRGIAGFGHAQVSSDYNGSPVTGTANIGGVGLLADVYFAGGGRITAGSLSQNYGADLAISGDITVEGNTFNNVDIVGSIDTLKRFAPVVAIGYEKTFRSNWGISADFGALYSGGFSLTATDNSTQIPQGDLDSELSSTNAELGQITLLPFVKLSVSFTF